MTERQGAAHKITASRTQDQAAHQQVTRVTGLIPQPRGVVATHPAGKKESPNA